MSKHQLLHHLPMPIVVCNITKFVDFMQFYAGFIPNFKVRIAPLQELMREEYTEPLGAKWTLIPIATGNVMCESTVKDYCLCQYDHWKLLVLHTNFSAEGFGYVAYQPADNNASIHAMASMYARQLIQLHDKGLNRSASPGRIWLLLDVRH